AAPPSGSRLVVRSAGRAAHGQRPLRRGGASPEEGGPARPQVGEGQLPAGPAPRAHWPQGGGGQVPRAREVAPQGGRSHFAPPAPAPRSRPMNGRRLAASLSALLLLASGAAAILDAQTAEAPPSISELEAAVARDPG